MKPVVLTAAGFDPTGGAGVIADCRILARHQVQPFSIITALTSQDSQGVYRVDAASPSLIVDQITRLLRETPLAAIKTGLLPNEEVISSLAKMLPAGIPLIVDPVLASSGGFPFLDEQGLAALKTFLFPQATLITPNREEAAMLSGIQIRNEADFARAAEKILSFGPKAVLIKDGAKESASAVDRLYGSFGLREFEGPKLSGVSVHGTGCALSSAIAAQMSLGKELMEAVEIAKRDIFRRMEKRVQLGKGRPQLNFDL